MEERIRQSETRQFKAIFPKHLNANETLFGGKALSWMDETAYITATRFTRLRMFTVNTESIKFLKPVFNNSIVEIIGKVEKVESLRIWVNVEIYAENMHSNDRTKAIEGKFVLSALNEKNKPKRIDYNSFAHS